MVSVSKGEPAASAAAVQWAAARPVVVGRLACGGAARALAGFGWWLDLLTLPLWLLSLAAVQLFWFAHAAVARVELGTDGVRVRGLRGSLTVGWSQVWRFLLVETPFARHIRL